MLRFRWIRWIRCRIPRGAKMMILAMILELFPGIRNPFFSQTVKKPKENQCFWLRTLKNLRKINVFALPEHLVTLGAPLGSARPKNYWRRSAPSLTWAEDEVTKVWNPVMIKFAVKFGKLCCFLQWLWHFLPELGIISQGGNRSSSKSIYTNSRFTACMRPASIIYV